jgi:hypothetical protein
MNYEEAIKARAHELLHEDSSTMAALGALVLAYTEDAQSVGYKLMPLEHIFIMYDSIKDVK